MTHRMKIAAVIPNYNSAHTVGDCVDALLRQTVPSGCDFAVVVADDGSTDGSADTLARRFGDRITLVRLPKNVGRSTARNLGAAASGADVLVFVDSDCLAMGDGFVAAHAATVDAGADVSFGAVCTPGPGFWETLQRDAASWRKRRFEDGEAWTFTTQNVAMRSDRFSASGGFDPAFDRFGFEDRDLFVRLADAGATSRYTAGAQVSHEDRISLSSVARKLGEAGFHAAHLFRARHPAIYRTMSFSKLDADTRPWLCWLDFLAWPLVRVLARGPARWLEWNAVPFRLRALAARAIYGLWFLHGTVRRRQGAATPA
jgi:glycosyltransferase involved in cell wall biosynthesis